MTVLIDSFRVNDIVVAQCSGDECGSSNCPLIGDDGVCYDD